VPSLCDSRLKAPSTPGPCSLVAKKQFFFEKKNQKTFIHKEIQRVGFSPPMQTYSTFPRSALHLLRQVHEARHVSDRSGNRGPKFGRRRRAVAIRSLTRPPVITKQKQHSLRGALAPRQSRMPPPKRPFSLANARMPETPAPRPPRNWAQAQQSYGVILKTVPHPKLS
jgi:hypothetical protein